jgi:hypothetical protein
MSKERFNHQKKKEKKLDLWTEWNLGRKVLRRRSKGDIN